MLDTMTRYASNSCLEPIVCPILISNHYSIFLSIGNIICNRINTPNPLKISKIDNSILIDINISDILKHTDVYKFTKCFINTLNDLIKSASTYIKISSKLKKK